MRTPPVVHKHGSNRLRTDNGGNTKDAKAYLFLQSSLLLVEALTSEVGKTFSSDILSEIIFGMAVFQIKHSRFDMFVECRTS